MIARRFVSLCFTFVIVLGLGSFLLAGDQDFTLTNKTGFVISSLFASPVKDRTWGNDILGEDELASGNSLEIAFSGYGKKCRFDLMVKDRDDNEYTVEDINLCEIHNITFTYKNKTLYWSAE
jgi:hypothetical protein